MHEAIPGPSGPGSVVLELGNDVGALVLETPAALLGREIEISPVGGAMAARRTHSLVRERRTATGTSYAAVYPGLRPAATSSGDTWTPPWARSPSTAAG